jgi:membrane protein YqaA with SNARE-associated domain
MNAFTKSRVAGAFRALFTVQLTLRQKMGLFLLASLIVGGLTYWLSSLLGNVGPWGYPLGFIINGLGAATVIVPSAGFAILVLMAQHVNPIWLGVAAGAGGTLGELSGYWLGAHCRASLEGSKLERFMNKYMGRYGGGIIFVSALIPVIPMDAAGLVAGSTRYPVARFLIYLSIGKILMTATILYFAVRAFDWAEPYLKWLIQ